MGRKRKVLAKVVKKLKKIFKLWKIDATILAKSKESLSNLWMSVRMLLSVRKSKGDVEKLKRKVEGDLKLTQEAVSDLERTKGELNQTIQRKEKEIASVSAKIDDEGTLG